MVARRADKQRPGAMRASVLKRVLVPALVLAGVLLAPLTMAAGAVSTALPTGGRVMAGSASFHQTQRSLDVEQTTGKAIINWQGFSIGAGAAVNFRQPGAGSVALNRVIGPDPSTILGRLTANGQVFLVNPNGVLFGKGARVNTGGLVASTLAIGNRDFMSGHYRFSREGATAGVTNQGSLLSKYVALLAPKVRNAGVIAAPLGTVALAAGDAVTLGITGNKLVDVQVSKAAVNTLVDNRKLIEVNGGTAILSAQSANALLGSVVNSGAVEANGISTSGGVIRLTASSHIADSGALHADAGSTGNGGRVSVIADVGNPASHTIVSGGISATGGNSSGNGGRVETSGSHLTIADSAVIDTSAAHGTTGQWLLDPTDFTVALSGGDMTGTALSAALASNDVTIQTGSGTNTSTSYYGTSGSNGDIFVDASVSWSSAHKLTLHAGRNITINAPITASGGTGSGVVLDFGQALSSTDLSNAAAVFIHAPINLASGSSFTTNFGNDGTPVNYTVIGNATALAGITNMSGDYVLGANISVSSSSPWTPIGTAGSPFTGIFDGLGHSVAGITHANTANGTDIGLFGYIGGPALVQNLGVINVNVAGATNVGGLAGENDGSIINSYSTGMVIGSDYTGGSASVGAIGGLVGNNVGNIASSYSMATVTASSGSQTGGFPTEGGIGGLVGMNQGPIVDSYATGSVSGLNDVGGFAGYSMGAIGASYAVGKVSGASTAATNLGGFLGQLPPPSPFGPTPPLLTDTYWDITTSGQSGSATDGVNLSTGLTTSQAQQQANYGNFDFSNIWTIRAGSSYPLLRSFMAPLYIKADDQSMTYNGSSFPASSYTATASSGIAPSADAKLSGTLTYGGTATTAVNAGSYTITPGGLSLANPADQQGYVSINYLNGTLKITQKTLTISGSLTGKVEKTYDGTNTATLTASNYQLTGWSGSDGAIVTKTTGSYASANAGSGIKVTVNLSAGNYQPTGSTNLANYSLPTSISGNVGIIDSKALSVTGLSVLNKVYDGTVSASLNGTATLLSSEAPGAGSATDGLPYSGDLVSLSGTPTGSYNSPNVATATSVSVAGLSLANNSNGDYTLSPVSLAAQISRRPITAVLTGTISKTYDGTTKATVGFTNFSYDVSNYVQGQGAYITGTDWQTGTYASANVGSNIKVTTTVSQADYQPANSSTDLNNYTFPTQISGYVGVITKKSLTVTGLLSQNKVYNGNTSASLTGTAALLTAEAAGAGSATDGKPYSGDNVSLTGTPTGTFNSKDVLTATSVNVAGLSLQNNVNNDYVLSPLSLTASITPKTVQVGASKIYDGTTSLPNADVLIATGVNNATLTATNVTAFSKDVKDNGTNYITSITLADGSDLASNYQLPTLNATNAPVYISQRSLSVSGTSVANKTYDGTTSATVSKVGTLSGLVGSETLVATATATFVSKDAGTQPANVSYTLADGQYGGLASNYSLAGTTATATIDPKTLDIAGLQTTRAYDGTTTAAISNPGLLGSEAPGSGATSDGKPYTADTVSLSGTPTATYNDKNVLKANTITIAGGSLTGAQAGDYVLATQVPGTITPKKVTMIFSSTAATLFSKTYDGNTKVVRATTLPWLLGYVFFTGKTSSSFCILCAIDGFVGNEALFPASITGQYSDKNAGSGKSVTLTMSNWNFPAFQDQLKQIESLSKGAISFSSVTFTAADPTNYSLPTSLSGNVGTIKARPVTVTLSGTASKVYDGSNVASLSQAVFTFQNFVSGEGVTVPAATTDTFDTPNVGTAKTVSVASSALVPNSATNLANYVIPGTISGVIGSITPRPLTATTTVATRPYDGTTRATFTIARISGLVGSQTLNVTPSGAFDSKNAGTRTATVNYALANGSNGGLAANYSLASQTLTGKISRKAVTLTPTAAQVVYDASNQVAANPAILNTLTSQLGVAGDKVTAVTLQLNSKAAGSNKTLTPSAAIISDGNKGANYNVTYQAASNVTVARATLDVTGLSVPASKIYDATDNATVSGTAALLAAIAPGTPQNGSFAPYSGDSVNVSGTPTATYNSKDVADATSVTVAGLTLTGTDAANYQLGPASLSFAAAITPKSLAVKNLSVPASKVYDGNAFAIVNGASLAVAENPGVGSTGDGQPYVGDAVTLTVPGFGFYNSKNVTAAKDVGVFGFSLSGAQASDYKVSQPGPVAATITPKPLDLLVKGALTQVYDATATFNEPGTVSLLAPTTGVNATDGKPVASDKVSVSPVNSADAGRIVGTMNGKDVNTATSLTVGPAYRLTGADAGNYTIAPNIAAVKITPKALDIVGISVPDRYANNSLVANIKGTPALKAAASPGTDSPGAPYSGDNAGVSGTITGKYQSETLFADNPVSLDISGLKLTARDTADYTLATPAPIISHLMSRSSDAAFTYLLGLAKQSDRETGGYSLGNSERYNGLGTLFYRWRDFHRAIVYKVKNTVGYGTRFATVKYGVTVATAAQIAKAKSDFLVQLRVHLKQLCSYCGFSPTEVANMVQNQAYHEGQQ